jgi:branched-chain amino acid transport system substrate-binding protein
MKRRQTVAVVLTAIVLSVGASTAGGAPSTAHGAKPIVIGAAVALSGGFSPYDAPALTTLKIYMKQLNARGGINGHPLKLVTADMKSNPALGPKAALQVISKGAQVLFATCDYDFGSPAAITAESKGIVTFSLCAGSAKFGPTGIGPLAFSAGTGNPVEAAVAAEWLQKRGYKRGYVLLDDTIEYTKSVDKYFEEAWKRLGGTIVGKDTFKNSDPSIATQITRLKSTKPAPDFIYLDTYTPGGASALRQIRSAGINTTVFASEGLEGTYWLGSVPNLSNFYTVYIAGGIHNDDPRPAINKLYKAYVAATGKPPTTSLAYTGYAGLQVLAAAIKKAGTTDGKKLAQVLVQRGPWNTILGKTHYTNKWHISLDRPEVVATVQNGKAKLLGLVKAKHVPTP